MKIITLLFLLLTWSIPLSAQKEGDVWIFGDSAGIKFSNFQPAPVVSANAAGASTSSISDKDGNLLYYCGISDSLLQVPGGIRDYAVFDSSGTVIFNGDELECQDFYSQGTMLIPAVGDTNTIYLFHLAGAPVGLHITLINKTLNNGQGGITVKNHRIDSKSCNEMMTAIKHGNGRDWWIITHRRIPGFNKYLLTENGISFHSSQTIGDTLTDIGLLIASPNGNRVVISDADYNELELYDFDRCTGTFNLRAELGMRNFNPFSFAGLFGCSFSSNSNILYGSTVKRLYQWDLLQLNIPASKTLIYAMHDTIEPLKDTALFLGHQIGPDNRIYIITNVIPDYNEIYHPVNLNLNVIENPNAVGIACSFNPLSQTLGGKRAILGFPTIPNFRLGTLSGSSCDTITHISTLHNNKDPFNFYPNPTDGDLNIDFNVAYDQVELKIIDLLGQVVFKKNAMNTHQMQAYYEGPPGLYFIRLVINNQAMTTQKIIFH